MCRREVTRARMTRHCVCIRMHCVGGNFLAPPAPRRCDTLRAMRIHKYLHLAAVTVLAAVGASIALHGQTPISVADHLAAQNAIFEDQYQSDLPYSPERATAYGDYRYNNQLGQRSMTAAAERNKTNRE